MNCGCVTISSSVASTDFRIVPLKMMGEAI